MKARAKNLDELIVNIDLERGLWQLNEKYIPFVQKFRKIEQTRIDWTLEHFDGADLRRKLPYVQAVPCVFLENWKKTGSLTMTYKELRRQLVKIFGEESVGKGNNLVDAWKRREKKFGLKSLFIKEKQGLWRLNVDYLDLVEQFCGNKN